MCISNKFLSDGEAAGPGPQDHCRDKVTSPFTRASGYPSPVLWRLSSSAISFMEPFLVSACSLPPPAVDLSLSISLFQACWMLIGLSLPHTSPNPIEQMSPNYMGI